MRVKVLVILLKYIYTYINVGYTIPTCVEPQRDNVWEIISDVLIS